MMNDKTDTTSTESEVSSHSNQSHHYSKSQRFWFWGLGVANVLLILVLLTIIIGMGFWFKQRQQSLEQTVSKLQHEQKQAEKINDSHQQKLSALQEQLQKLESQQSPDKGRWLLAKVKYLTRLASYNLHFLHDAAGTRTLLQQAKAQLDDQAPAEYVQLRRQLQQYIDQLGKIDQHRISDTILKLDSIAQTIPELPIQRAPSQGQNQFASTEQPTTESSSNNAKWWTKVWDQGRYALEQAVTIRYHKYNVKPLIAPEAHVYLVNNLQTKLYQAQWAAMRQKTKMYQHQLQLIQKWIQQYFDTQQKPTQVVIKRIKHLQQRTIAPDLPDLKQLIQAVNREQKQHFHHAQATD